jgi:hypothetical protein
MKNPLAAPSGKRVNTEREREREEEKREKCHKY